MTDELTPEDERETRRKKLIADAKASDKAMEAYEKARKKHELAVEKEKQRQKKEEQRLKELLKASYEAHRPVEAAAEARRTLLSEYVDRDIVRQRDRASMLYSRQEREWRKAHVATMEQRATNERRSAQTIIGTLRDANGRPIPENPNDTFSKPKRGPVRNPQRFRSPEEREHYEAILAQLEKQEEEQRVVLERLKKALDEAQAKFDAAVDLAWAE